jgi:hypothetical protein
MKIPSTPTLLLAGSIVLAGAAGGLGAVAISSGAGAADPTKTVTIQIQNGTTGPAGPTGPEGPAGPPGPKGDPGTGGADNCPSGSTFGEVNFVIQGQGPTAILTCIKDVP